MAEGNPERKRRPPRRNHPRPTMAAGATRRLAQAIFEMCGRRSHPGKTLEGASGALGVLDATAELRSCQCPGAALACLKSLGYELIWNRERRCDAA